MPLVRLGLVLCQLLLRDPPLRLTPSRVLPKAQARHGVNVPALPASSGCALSYHGLVVGGLGVDVVDGPADIHLDGAVGRSRRDGGDGAELPSGGGSA